MTTTAPVWAWCPPWGKCPFGASDKGIRTNQGVSGNRLATAVAFWKSWEFIGASGNDSRAQIDEDAVVHKHVAYFEHVGQVTPQARSVIDEDAVERSWMLLGKAQQIRQTFPPDQRVSR